MADQKKIKIRGGTLAELRTIQLDNREMGLTTDTKEAFFGGGTVNNNLTDKARVYMPVDWSDKASGVNFFKKISGGGTLSYDATDSAMGKGCFAVTAGGGVWEVERAYPVAPLFGIGGHCCIKGSGLFNIGVNCYDANMNLLSMTAAQKNFVVNGVVGTGAFTATKNYLIDEGVGVRNFPVGTRFIKPQITISSNAGTVKFDAFIIYPSNFSILSLYA
jgi:hypothetical protein